MPRLTIAPFGASMTIDSDDDRVVAAAMAALDRYPNDGGVASSIDLVARTVEGDEPTSWPATSRTEQDGVSVLRCGGTTLTCDHQDGRATLHATPASLACADELRMFVEAAFWSPVISTGAVRAVHSALVVDNGVGLLLRGESGAGKSTLSYAALRAGFGVVSDDWLYSPAGDEPDRMWGYPWRMWMTTEASNRFPELADATAVAHPGSDRLKVPIEVPAAQQLVRHSVHAVVMISPGESLSVEPIDVGEARRRFEKSALDSELGSLPPPFVDRLLDRPCYLLERGTSPESAIDALASLADQLRRDVDRPATNCS